MEYDIHTILDLATLGTTLWVIYMIRFNLKTTYMEEKDNFALYYVLAPCVVLAVWIHPSTSHNILNRISWGFCVYLEAVSVLPQLRVMQNTKIVEPFTAHYVFALGVARFFSCAHWVLQVGSYLQQRVVITWLSCSFHLLHKPMALQICLTSYAYGTGANGQLHNIPIRYDIFASLFV